MYVCVCEGRVGLREAIIKGHCEHAARIELPECRMISASLLHADFELFSDSQLRNLFGADRLAAPPPCDTIAP